MEPVQKQDHETLREVLTQRQFNWICSLDEAYIDAFFAMLETAGRDGRRLIHSRSEHMRRYIQYRYGLLHQNMLRGFQEQHKLQNESGDDEDHMESPRLRRFGYTPRENLKELFDKPLTDEQGDDSTTHRLLNSYHAWRRMLLWKRFYAFRNEVEDTILRRMAADAMNRAMVAEREEREKYYQMSDSDSNMDSSSSDEEDDHVARRRRNARKHAETRWTVPIGMTEWVILSSLQSDRRSLRLLQSNGKASDGQRIRSSSSISPNGYATTIKFARGHTNYTDNSDTDISEKDPSDRVFALGTCDGSVAIVDALRNRLISVAVGSEGKGHTDSVTCLDWSPENMYLVSSGTDRTLRIWSPHFDLNQKPNRSKKDAPPEQLTCIRKVECSLPVSHCLFLPTNANVVVFAEDCKSSSRKPQSLLSSPLARFRGSSSSTSTSSISALNVSTGKVIQRVASNAPTCSLSINHNGSQLFAGDTTGRLFSHSIAIDPQSQLSSPIGELKRFINISAPADSPLAARSESVHHSPFRLRRERVVVIPTLPSPVVKLSYKPYDTRFRCPLLVCVDKTGEVFALKLSVTVNAMQSSSAKVASHAPHYKTEQLSARGRSSKPQFQSSTRIMAKFEYYIKPRVRSTGMKLNLCSPCHQSDCIAIGTFGRDVQIIDPHAKTISMTFVAALLGHSGTVLQLAWNNSETCLVTGDQSGKVVIWGQKKATEALGIEAKSQQLSELSKSQKPSAPISSAFICPNCQKRIKESQMLSHVEECVG